MFAPPTTGSSSNSLTGMQGPLQLGPTLLLPLTSCHIPIGILTVAMLLNGQSFACLGWLTHIFYFTLFLQKKTHFADPSGASI